MNETQTMSRPAAKTEEAAREQLRSAGVISELR